MLKIQYNEVLSILSVMERTMLEMEESLSEFSQATAVYNATMQDDLAKEATNIVNSLREEIERMKSVIEKSAEKVKAGTAGLKQIEDRARNGGLKV